MYCMSLTHCVHYTKVCITHSVLHACLDRIRYVPKELINEAKKHYSLKRVTNIDASSHNTQTLQMEQETTSMHITQSSAVSTSNSTCSSVGKSVDSSSTQQQRHSDLGRGGEVEGSNKEESMVCREPLLDM